MVWQKPLKNYCIYAIKCPDTNGIKYVGLTTNGITRLYGHWRDFKPNKDGKIIRIKAWIKKLKSEGKRFLVEYLDYADSKEELIQKEIYWIKFYRDSGIQLLNHADGGYLPTIKEYSEEERLKISKKTKEAMSRPDVKKNLMDSIKTRVMPKRGPMDEEKKLNFSNSDYANSLKTQIKDSNGNIYSSITECAKAIGVSGTAISNAIKNRKMCKGVSFIVIDSGRKIDKNNIKLIKKIQDQNGVIYNGQKDAAKKLNISPETVFRLLKSGKTSKNGVRLFYVR